MILIAALAILVLSVAPPDNLSNITVEAAARRLEQDIRYARELAMSRNVNCGIQFQSNGDYLVYETTPTNPVLNPLTQQTFDYNLGDTFRNVNLVNVSGTLLVEFNPLGQPVQGGGTTLQVGNGVTTVSLVVTNNTGLVTRP